MGDQTAISWATHTFNTWIGCEHAPSSPGATTTSPECDNCYAEQWDHRGLHGGESHWGSGSPRRMMSDAYWRKPIKWNADALKDGVRPRVFCSSLADVFEDRRDLDAPRMRLWHLIDETPHLDWLLLTKRPEHAAAMVPWYMAGSRYLEPWANVWLGVTCGVRGSLHRVHRLREIPAAVRFVSGEPLLEHITAEDWNAVLRFRHPDHHGHAGSIVSDASNNPAKIDWLIIGDESAVPQKRRAAQVDWVRTAREAAQRNGVAFHFKQWCGPDGGGISGRLGEKRKIHLPILDGKQWAQFPVTGAK